MVLRVVEEAYLSAGGLKVASNFAREHAQAVAAAASMGFITTAEGEGYGRTWRATGKGIDVFLEPYASIAQARGLAASPTGVQ